MHSLPTDHLQRRLPRVKLSISKATHSRASKSSKDWPSHLGGTSATALNSCCSVHSTHKSRSTSCSCSWVHQPASIAVSANRTQIPTWHLLAKNLKVSCQRYFLLTVLHRYAQKLLLYDSVRVLIAPTGCLCALASVQVALCDLRYLCRALHQSHWRSPKCFCHWSMSQ